MSNTIGARLKLEGESEYQKALREITADQKLMASELDLVAAKFAGQENSIEAVTAKHDILQRALNSEQEKVNNLREELQKAAEKYGESNTRVQEFQTKLNKAEAQLEKTKKQVADTEQQLEDLSDAELTGAKSTEEFSEAQRKTGENMTGLGDMLDKIAQKFGVQLPSSLTQTANGLGSVDVKALAFVGTAGAIVTALVAVEKKLTSMTKESAAFADEILTTSTITGISTENLQAYAYAAELVDVSIETLTGAQTKLINNMSAAAEGSAKQVSAFADLGVRITDTNGHLRNSENVMWDVIDALGRIDNETERDAAAMELMGKSAQDLNPIIKAGSATMKQYAAEAKEVGYVLSNEQLDALGGVDDAYQRLTKTVDGAKNQLAAQFAPAMATATDNTTGFIQKVSQSAQQTHIVEKFGDLLTNVSGLLDPIAEFISWGAPGLAKAFDVASGSAAILSDTLRLIVGILQMLSIVNVGKGIDNINTALGTNISNGKLSAQQKLYYKDTTSVYDPEIGAWVGNYAANNAAGSYNWRGGVTWVGEAGPEKVYLPEGSRIETAQESRMGGDNFYITIDAKSIKEFNDIVAVAQSARMNARRR